MLVFRVKELAEAVQMLILHMQTFRVEGEEIEEVSNHVGCSGKVVHWASRSGLWAAFFSLNEQKAAVLVLPSMQHLHKHMELSKS